MRSSVIIFVLVVGLASAIENGLGRTPQMGWNPWNKFGCGINETLIKLTADQLVDTGLVAKGYVYLNLDDCWQIARDNVTKRIIPDPEKFPSGIKALADYVHSKGLKLGLYSDAGFQTCEGRPGSLGYEEIDAKTYAEWDIDYLKYDNCHHDGSSPKLRYPPMAKALMAQEKKIFFSMCEWGQEKPHLWARELANSWRTTPDIKDSWWSFLTILELQNGLEDYAGPGGWNDPDMLEVGNGGMTDVQYQSHFALWALLKAPLIIGCDVANMTEATQRILMNEEVIAVNQDSLGKQGKRIHKFLSSEVWAVEVADNGHGHVVILFNQAMYPVKQSVKFSQLNIQTTTQSVRDLINKVDLPQATDSFSATVPAHGVVMVKFTNPSQIE